jgi:phenolic acid decarboxylase
LTILTNASTASQNIDQDANNLAVVEDSTIKYASFSNMVEKTANNGYQVNVRLPSNVFDFSSETPITVSGSLEMQLAESTGMPIELVTSYSGADSGGGGFFDIEVINDILLNGVKVNIANGDPSALVEVYYHPGEYIDVMSNTASWTKLVGPITVTSAGTGTGSMITFPTPKFLSGSATTHAFYIARSDGGALVSSRGTSEGEVWVQDGNIKIKVGRLAAYPMGTWVLPPYILNGALNYNVISARKLRSGVVEPESALFKLDITLGGVTDDISETQTKKEEGKTYPGYLIPLLAAVGFASLVALSGMAVAIHKRGAQYSGSAIRVEV